MLLLTRVKATFADVCCPLCGGAFAVAGVQVRAGKSPEEQQWLQHALERQHQGGRYNDPESCHAPSFPLFAPPLPAKRPRLRGALPAVGLPYGSEAALRYNG